MTPNDHNRTLSIIYGVIGTLVLIGLLVAAISEARRHPHEAVERLWWVLYVLPLSLLQLLTAYGVFTLRKWGRFLALLFTVFYVWAFPFGTLLAIYTGGSFMAKRDGGFTTEPCLRSGMSYR